MTKKAKKKPHTSELKLRQNRGSWAKNDPNLLRVGGGDPARKKIKIAKAGGEEEEI